MHYLHEKPSIDRARNMRGLSRRRFKIKAEGGCSVELIW
jgi:hypothetical protein